MIVFRTAPGICKHSRNLSFNHLLQDSNVIYRDKWQSWVTGLWGRHLGDRSAFTEAFPRDTGPDSGGLFPSVRYNTASPSASPSLHFALSPASPQAWPPHHQPHHEAFLHLEIILRAGAIGQVWWVPRPLPRPHHPEQQACGPKSSSASEEMVGLAWKWPSWTPCRKEPSQLGRAGSCLPFHWQNLSSHKHFAQGSFQNVDMPSWPHLLLTGTEESSQFWF